MPCNSKLSRVDEKIHVLERSLIKHCQLIDDLAKKFDSLYNLPTKESKQTKRQSILECHIEQAKGKHLSIFKYFPQLKFNLN